MVLTASQDARLPVVFVCCIFLCSVFPLLAGAALPDQSRGAMPTSRLLNLVERSLRQPDQRESLQTIIIETDEPGDVIRQLIASGGGKLRYQFDERYEIQIRTDRIQALLSRLPENSLARLPWPHEAVAVTSQGVALTGASDMQVLGNDGTGIKIGVIDLGFGGLASAIASSDLPAGQTVVDYTGTGPRSCTTWRPVPSFTWPKSTPMSSSYRR